MNHWVDPDKRGLYDHPHAPPPPPAHHASNDLGTRLARVEEHINFQAWNHRRSEHESRLRAEDIVAGMATLSRRILAIEQTAKSRRYLRQTMQGWATSASIFGRYAAAAVLGLLLLTGKASLENVKFLLSLLGLPAG